MPSSKRSERCETCEWSFLFWIIFQTSSENDVPGTRNIKTFASIVTYTSFNIAWQLFCVVNRHIVFHMNLSCRSNFSIIKSLSFERRMSRYIRGKNQTQIHSAYENCVNDDGGGGDSTNLPAKWNRFTHRVQYSTPQPLQVVRSIFHEKKMNASKLNACLCRVQDTTARWNEWKMVFTKSKTRLHRVEAWTTKAHHIKESKSSKCGNVFTFLIYSFRVNEGGGCLCIDLPNMIHVWQALECHNDVKCKLTRANLKYLNKPTFSKLCSAEVYIPPTRCALIKWCDNVSHLTRSRTGHFSHREWQETCRRRKLMCLLFISRTTSFFCIKIGVPQSQIGILRRLALFTHIFTCDAMYMLTPHCDTSRILAHYPHGAATHICLRSNAKNSEWKRASERNNPNFRWFSCIW